MGEEQFTPNSVTNKFPEILLKFTSDAFHRLLEIVLRPSLGRLNQVDIFILPVRFATVVDDAADNRMFVNRDIGQLIQCCFGSDGSNQARLHSGQADQSRQRLLFPEQYQGLGCRNRDNYLRPDAEQRITIVKQLPTFATGDKPSNTGGRMKVLLTEQSSGNRAVTRNPDRVELFIRT